jgi:hypothetical protein
VPCVFVLACVCLLCAGVYLANAATHVCVPCVRRVCAVCVPYVCGVCTVSMYRVCAVWVPLCFATAATVYKYTMLLLLPTFVYLMLLAMSMCRVCTRVYLLLLLQCAYPLCYHCCKRVCAVCVPCVCRACAVRVITVLLLLLLICVCRV